MNAASVFHKCANTKAPTRNSERLGSLTNVSLVSVSMLRPVLLARTRNHHATSTVSKEKSCNTLKDSAAQSAFHEHSRKKVALQ